ncbi:hypothetical protein H4Q26_005621 [Puccinia striiformis f. sp. tritici PST-130]|nr:hypothetical protein H4Q26_005621 [Puccinia striiformis f. sp. tritici PST-130]
MDSNPSQQASNAEWVLQIIPEMGLTGDRDNSLPGQPALPRDRPASAGTVYFNRTIPSKNQQCGSDVPPLCHRRTILWTERLCLELVTFFGAWFSRHKELVDKSSAYLVKATYFSNFVDVLRAYPRLNGCVRIIEMKGQYTHLCTVWKKITGEMNLSAGDPMPVDFTDCVSNGGMSPLVVILLKHAIEERQQFQSPFMFVESPEDKVTKSTAACASFLIDGIQAPNHQPPMW